MNIDEFIERECPRYMKEITHMGTAQSIVDTHSLAKRPLKTFALNDDSIDVELEDMNRAYELQLRDFYSKRERV